MKLSIFFLSSTLASFITPGQWIQRRIGSDRITSGKRRVKSSTRDPAYAFYKMHHKELKIKVCNVQTCQKCISVLSRSFSPPQIFSELCNNIISLSNCCPQKILLQARFWSWKIKMFETHFFVLSTSSCRWFSRILRSHIATKFELTNFGNLLTDFAKKIMKYIWRLS